MLCVWSEWLRREGREKRGVPDHMDWRVNHPADGREDAASHVLFAV